MIAVTLVRQNLICTADELAQRRQPRTDIVAEKPAGPDCWELLEGPFRSYQRSLISTGQPDGTFVVTEETRYRLAIPVWGWLFWWPVRRAISRRQATFSYWWAPPQRIPASASTVLGLLCAIQIVDGYLGTVLTQTLSFATDEFGAGTGAQGLVFGLVRFGVLITIVMAGIADRRGRRPLLMFTGLSSCVMTIFGGLAPNLVVLGGSQLAARGLSTALGILIAIMAVEEMPPRARAWAASVLTMSAGLGAGLAVWALPLADLNERGWRAIYLIAALGVLVLLWAGRQLPETSRFRQHTNEVVPDSPDLRQRRQERLVLLGVSLGLLALFTAPASGFQNEFLRDERGFTGTDIAIYTLVTSTPIGLGVLVGGHLSETWGRRQTAILGLVVGTAGTVVSFLTVGPLLWISRLVANVVGAVAVPALAVYGPELFGTHDRGRANAIIVTAGVAGSAIGLVTTGLLADRWDGLGLPIAILAVGPGLVALLVFTRFPETAGRELEELNPEDA